MDKDKKITVFLGWAACLEDIEFTGYQPGIVITKEGNCPVPIYAVRSNKEMLKKRIFDDLCKFLDAIDCNDCN